MSNSSWPHRRQPTRLPHPWDSLGKNTGVGCHFLLQCRKVKSESEVTQSCPTLVTPWTAAYQAPPSMGFSRQNYWRGVPWGVGVLTWKISVPIRRDMRAFSPTHTHIPHHYLICLHKERPCENTARRNILHTTKGILTGKQIGPNFGLGLLLPDLSKYISVVLATQSVAVPLHFLQLELYLLHIWRLLTFLLAILIQICRWYQSNGRKQRTKEPLDEGKRGEWKS